MQGGRCTIVERTEVKTDPAAVQAFGRRLLDLYTGAMLTFMLDLGSRTGLFEAAAAGPGTSAGIAARAGLNERYVREWLSAMAAGGIVRYDAATGVYTLPPEHALLLTGESARNLAPQSRFLDELGRHVPQVERAFREGGGVPYAEYQPEFSGLMGEMWRRIYDEQLIEGFLPVAAGLPERLKQGIDVLDIGCGTGHAINLMARAYPRSRFTGYDLSADAIAAATAEAAQMGLPNARFAVLDVLQLPCEPKFDLIMAFDAIHDQVDPAGVLRGAAEALASEGTFFMVDFRFSSRLENNLTNPFAALYYGVSTLHCMTVSLAEGGAGLGTVWGEELARQMLAEAGFTQVDVLPSPRPQNSIYVCRKRASTG
jgi:SAM-dependent methyltransferase